MNLQLTLKKSLIGRLPKHQAIAQALGLSRINQTVVKPFNPCILGMVNKINYLLTVQRVA